jgi:DNA polymerase III subunit delta'
VSTDGCAALEPRANPELVGQERAVAVLERAWRSGQLPHGWLIGGPRGVGKATLAFRFARALLAGPAACDDTLGLDPAHPVFRQVAAGAHPDLHLIEPARDARSGRTKAEITVDAVRRASHALHSTAAMGGRRVVIVDGAELLNRNAANALLKPLEEPPQGAVLLLVSHQPGRVLPTLRSRCAKLRLAALPEATVLAILKGRGIGGEEASALARLARGSPGRAVELAAGGALALYRRLVEGLGREPLDRAALRELAAELAKHADQQGPQAPMALIQELLGRAIASAQGRLGPAVHEAEPAALGRLIGRLPLDRWAALWEKIARLAARADAVNLDRFHVLLHVLTLLAAVPGEGELPPPDGVPLGGHHALG